MSPIAKVRAALLRLWSLSIWHPDAIDPEEWKFRNLMRLWLPVYDVLMIMAGIWAYFFGSPILHRLFPEEYIVDFMGILLTIVASVCLAGVVFPGLSRIENWGKLVLVGLLGAYAGAIAVFNSRGDITSWFVVFIVLATLPLPMFRLSMLGEEAKESREEEE